MVVRKVHIYLSERNRNSLMLTNLRIVHLLNFSSAFKTELDIEDALQD
jgi:hypothetical protein